MNPTAVTTQSPSERTNAMMADTQPIKQGLPKSPAATPVCHFGLWIVTCIQPPEKDCNSKNPMNGILQPDEVVARHGDDVAISMPPQE